MADAGSTGALPAVGGPVDRAARRSLGPLGRAALPAVAALGSLGAVAMLRTVSPYRPGIYPTCPTYALTGLYCPGCGALRALHDLGNVDLGAAWGMNPLVVLAVPVLVALWWGWSVRRVAGRPRRRLAPPWAMYALLSLVVMFAVARNVPVLAPWLAPG